MSLLTLLRKLSFTLFVLSGCLICCSSATSHNLQAVFSMGGIKGHVTFSQPQHGNPTDVLVRLEGVNETLGWSILELPMIYYGNAAMSCSADAIGALFDPMMALRSPDYNSSCDSTNSSRFQTCAIGDLSGMLGNLDVNTSQGNFTHQSLMIPISGPYSIMGRTLVLYSDGVPKACALITPLKSILTAVAVFKAPVAGSVYLRQANDSSDTSIFANLFYVNNAQSQGQFTWQINHGLTPCESSSEIFNPRNSDGGNCSQMEQGNCQIGDLTSKHGNVTVSMATKGQSKTRKAFTDTNLPLSGGDSVIGKTIVLFSIDDPQRPFACAKIMAVKPRILKAVFNPSVHGGIGGYFKFTQPSPFDPTKTEIDVSGLNETAQGYHVHNYPMPWQMKYTGSESCAGGYLGGHWNPFGIDVKSSPSSGSGTNDEYEIGDLSGKYGSFLNLTNYKNTHFDYNLPLFGKNSIQGRSIVIHKMKTLGSKRWVCADVYQPVVKNDVFVMKTKITFTGPALQGYILLVQYKFDKHFMAAEETSIYIDLTYVSNSSKKSVDHPWHVHVHPEGNDTYAEMGKRCKSLGPHYNPYQVDLAGTYKSSCFSGNMLRCEVGDLSGKHARLDVGSGKQFFTDPDLPLFGEMSVVGRGIVIHAEQGGSSRLACASIEPVASLYVEKSLQHVDAAGFSRKHFVTTISSLLNIPEWRLFYVREEDSKFHGCMTIKFGIIGNEKQTDEPSTAFDLILRRSPGKFMEFQPRDKCRAPITTETPKTVRSGSQANHVNMLIIFIMISIALRGFCI